MEPAVAAAAQAGSLACGGIGVAFHNQFGEPEEFHRPISVPQENNDSSFTSLLELPENQAMELLVHSTDDAATAAVTISAASVTPPPHMLLPIFSSNAALVDRAVKFTRFAKSDSLKQEAEGSDSDPNSNSYCSVLNRNTEQKLNSSTKRKEREKKEKEGSSKKAAKEEGAKKGDYVHVRARRGQATDSHSLAERARREKINAKMKLLQEMVPGCNKISGTALVLDEIINHVQSLQRQIEILSMRLAAVNTTTNFSFETLMTNENGSTMDNDFPGMVMMPSDWHEEEQFQKNGLQNKQFWHSNDFHQLNWPPSTSREDDHLNFHIPQDSQLAYGSSSISVASALGHRRIREMPSPKPLSTAAVMLRSRFGSSLRTRGGVGEGISRWTSPGHQERPNGYLFNRTPLPPGASRKWEDWELPCYITSFLTIVILGVGLNAKPDLTIETWAHQKALERLQLESGASEESE